METFNKKLFLKSGEKTAETSVSGYDVLSVKPFDDDFSDNELALLLEYLDQLIRKDVNLAHDEKMDLFFI